MEGKIFEVIKDRIGLATWHTSHPLDTKRFHAAITRLHREVGSKVNESIFKKALQRHNKTTAPILGGKASEEQIEYFTKKAMVILAYLKDERKS